MVWGGPGSAHNSSRNYFIAADLLTSVSDIHSIQIQKKKIIFNKNEAIEWSGDSSEL